MTARDAVIEQHLERTRDIATSLAEAIDVDGPSKAAAAAAYAATVAHVSVMHLAAELLHADGLPVDSKLKELLTRGARALNAIIAERAS